MFVQWLFGVAVAVSLFSAGQAQAAEITYQGRLAHNGVTGNGRYDFIFGIFDPNGGSNNPPAVTPLSQIAVMVSNGLFVSRLDFGEGAFTGGPRVMEISVRTNGSQGPYTVLSPRQPITAAPYAIQSVNAETAGTASNVPASGLTGMIPDTRLSNNVARLVDGKLPDNSLSPNVPFLNANQTFSGANTFDNGLAVNGTIYSVQGGVRFPDQTLQLTAASNSPPGTKIVAAVNMNFSVDDRSQWTHVENLADDTCFSNIPLGFTYTGFGANTSEISLSSNGILFFGANACSTALANGPLPTGISQSAMLFFFWDDLLDKGAGEYFEYFTFGNAGSRVFHLYFRMAFFDAACGTAAMSAMISIHEGSNLIKVSYPGINGCPLARASSATLGFQTTGGSSATAFMVGSNVPLLDDNSANQSMSFHPPN